MSLKGEPFWKFAYNQDKCACCGFPIEGLKRIGYPSWLDHQFICPDCIDGGWRVCGECGTWSDDADMPAPAEVSFCKECRGVESMISPEVESCRS